MNDDAHLTENMTNSLDALRPFGGEHAIQTAAVAFTWSTEMPLSDLRSLRSRAATAVEIKQAFPTIEDRHVVKFALNNVGSSDARANAPSVQTGPFVLNSLPATNDVAPARSIAVDMRQVVISIADYDRWSKLLEDLQLYLPTLFSSFSARNSISTIGLQYVDAFEWQADRSELDLKAIFKETSPYIVGNAFRTGENWHSHHGLFTTINQPITYRRLDNINISREDQDARHVLQIVTSHQAQLATTPLWRWAESKLPVVLEVLGQLHEQNKQLLRELLTPKVQIMIKLDSKTAGG